VFYLRAPLGNQALLSSSLSISNTVLGMAIFAEIHDNGLAWSVDQPMF
jgi:hypothetical protein